MGDLTWVLVLSSIAILFPLVLTAAYNYMGFEDDLIIDNSMFYDNGTYQQICDMNCSNYNLTLLNDYKYYFDTGIRGIPPAIIVEFNCMFNDDYMSDWITNRILDYDEMNEYDLQQNKFVQKFTKRIGLKNFFDAMKTLPNVISGFIYAIYGILLLWLVYKAFTLA